MLVPLTLRNILTLVLFGWSVTVLARLTRPFASHDTLRPTDAWLPAAWPFTERGPHPRSTDDDRLEDSTA
jgi:hypothetical protein